jgi:hypothetical protein
MVLGLASLRAIGALPLPLAGEGWGGGTTCTNFPHPLRPYVRGDLPRKRERSSDSWHLYRPLPARLNKNTPCSPNMFQNHQGALSRSGRP